MVPRPYTVDFPRHGHQILEQLNVQRYYGNFCDIILRTEDTDLKVHRCVLAASSAKLQALMFTQLHESVGNVLMLKDITSTGVRAVIEYMYTGELRLDAMTVQDILVASQHLELRSVEKSCLEFYKSIGAEAPLPPLEAALGLMRMSSGMSIPSGIGAGFSYPSSSLPVVVSSPAQQQTSHVSIPPICENQNVHGPALPRHSGNNKIISAADASTGDMSPHMGQPSPHPPSQVPAIVTHTQTPAIATHAIHAPMTHATTGNYTNPTPNMNIDTNYIEDYLKIIESFQGEQSQQQLENQPADAHVTQMHSQLSPEESSMPLTNKSVHAHNNSQQGFIVPGPQEYKDVSRANVAVNMPSGPDAQGNPPPPVAVVNPRTLTYTTPSHGMTCINSGSTQHPSTSSSQYNAEEVRRTILNVLSQEKFDDEEDEEAIQKLKEPVPLTSLLNIQPLAKPADITIINQRTSSLSLNIRDALASEDEGLPMANGAMDISSESDHDDLDIRTDGSLTLTKESDMSSNVTSGHSGHNSSESVVSQEAMYGMRPQFSMRPPLSEPLFNIKIQENEPQLTTLSVPQKDINSQMLSDQDIGRESQVNNMQHNPLVGGPLILRIKRKQKKGFIRDDFYSPEEQFSRPDERDNHTPDVNTFDPPMDMSTTNYGQTSVMSYDEKAKLSHSICSTKPYEPTTSTSYTLPVECCKSCTTTCNSVSTATTTPKLVQQNESNISDRVSTCPKPFKKRIPNRPRSVNRKASMICDKCGREFDKQDNLEKHKALHAGDTFSAYCCHVCGYKYNRPGELTRHMRKHSSNVFPCTECNSEFRDSRLYRRHMMSIHGNDKPFHCTFPGCSYRGNKLSHIEKHLTIHSDVKAYDCNRCGKGFSQPNGLRSHMKSCMEKRGYECNICSQKFNHLAGLKAHAYVHTGEKPFICEECGARFTDARNKKRHARIHDNIYPYPCTICSKKFRHSNSLKTHLNQHTKKDQKKTVAEPTTTAASHTVQIMPLNVGIAASSHEISPPIETPKAHSGLHYKKEKVAQEAAEAAAAAAAAAAATNVTTQCSTNVAGNLPFIELSTPLTVMTSVHNYQ